MSGPRTLTDGLVRRFVAEMGGGAAHVIATGGVAALLAPHTETITVVEPDLTLFGLRLIFERSQPPCARRRGARNVQEE